MKRFRSSTDPTSTNRDNISNRDNKCSTTLEKVTPKSIKCIILSYLEPRSFLYLSYCNTTWNIASKQLESICSNRNYIIQYKDDKSQLSLYTQLVRFKPRSMNTIDLLCDTSYVNNSHDLKQNHDLKQMQSSYSQMSISLQSLNLQTASLISHFYDDSFDDMSITSSPFMNIISLTIKQHGIHRDMIKLFPNLLSYNGRIDDDNILDLPTTLTSLSIINDQYYDESIDFKSVLEHLSCLTHLDCKPDSYMDNESWETLLLHPTLTSIGSNIWNDMEYDIINNFHHYLTNSVFQRLTSIHLTLNESNYKCITTLLICTPNLTELHLSLNNVDDNRLEFSSTSLLTLIPYQFTSRIKLRISLTLIVTDSIDEYIKLLTSSVATSIVSLIIIYDTDWDIKLDPLLSLLSLPNLNHLTSLNELTYCLGDLSEYDINDINVTQLRWCDTFSNNPQLNYISFKGSLSTRHKIWLPMLHGVTRTDDINAIEQFEIKLSIPRLYLSIKMDTKYDDVDWMHLKEYGILHVPSNETKYFSYDERPHEWITRCNDYGRFEYRNGIYHYTDSHKLATFYSTS